VLTVRDEGPGIGPCLLSRLFEPFVRAEDTQSVPGLGLGLYVVRGIVQAHGGTVEVESTPGKGATFIVRLPRRAGEGLQTGADRHPPV
jgi:signal transduction histidine kinase